MYNSRNCSEMLLTTVAPGGNVESNSSRLATIAESAGRALKRTAASEASDTIRAKSSTITLATAAN